MSLTKATSSLQEDVQRLESFGTRLSSTITSTIASKLRDIHTTSNSHSGSIKNATDSILEMVEAVASNTGWLPVIHRDVRQVALIANRTMYMSTGNNGILQQIQQYQRARAREQGISSNRISRIPPPASNELPDTHERQSSEIDSSLNAASVSGSEEDLVIDRESLQIISKTSRQLNRIMPALTKLLAEPGKIED